MRLILRSPDPVLISFAEATLAGAGIEAVVADRYISGAEGGIGAFPQRVLVRSADWMAACRALELAGLGKDIVRDAP